MDDSGAPRMEMRALLAIVLSMMVLTLYQYFFVPPPEALPPEEAAAAVAPSPPGAPSLEPQASPGAVATEALSVPAAPAQDEPDLAAGAIERTEIRGAQYLAVVSNRGGVLESFVLAGFDEPGSDELNLVNPLASAAETWPLRLETPTDNALAAQANAALYVVEVEGGRTGGGAHAPLPDNPVRVTLRWRGGGWSVTKTLTFAEAGYLVGLDLAATAPGRAPIYVALGPGLNFVDPTSSNTFLCECAPVSGPDGVEHYAVDDLEAPLDIAGTLRWVGVESHYFLSAFLLDRPALARVQRVPLADPAAATADGAPGTRDLLSVALAVEGSLSTTLFLGPKKYDLLSAQGYDLADVVDFGMFGIVGRPLLALLNWIYAYVANYGVAIILLTALLRLVFLPLNHRAMVSMRRTQQLQPQMAAIRAKYKGAKEIEKRQKMNEEVMELYKREGVSPFGGCLPMLAQMPILFAFYALLSVAVELRGAPFGLWIHDLSKYDPYLVLPLLMGGSMIVQQRMTPTTGVNPAQARMMNLMPIMFTVLFLYVPSGLVLYWLVNNLLGIAQQLYVTRHIAGPAPEAKAPKRGRKGERGNP